MNSKDFFSTSDLWEAAYILAQRGELSAIEGNGGNKAMFIFKSDEARKMAQEYEKGHALVDVTSLKASMMHLRSLIFNNA